MRRAREVLWAVAACGLAWGCKVSTTAAPVPLTQPVCEAGQPLLSDAGGWSCLDLSTVHFASAPSAASADTADLAAHVDSVPNAGTADVAAEVTSTTGALIGDAASAGDSLQVVGAALLHDGNPVAAVVGTRSLSSPADGGESLGELSVAGHAGRTLTLTASGALTAAGATLAAPKTCHVSLRDDTHPSASLVFATQDLQTWNPSSSVAGSTAFIVRYELPIDAEGERTLGVRLFNDDHSCTLAASGGQLTVEEH